MKTAVIYARYSSESQTEQSIDGQLRVCEEYAKTNDILILDKYIDRAMTGTNDNRPNFQRMIADSGKKQWNYVLVYKIDRFSRNKYEIAKYKYTLKNNGVKLLSAMEYIPDTPESIIVESMLEGYAEYYSAELSQKVKRGLNESRIKGNYTGGFILYGYKVENKKIIIDEEVAEIVSDYLKMLYEKTPKNKLEMHWIVELMKKYADEKYSYNIMVKEFAVTHQMNEKYIGRLFKKQMGVSFKDYCNNLRLKEAENLLTNSSKKIIDIVFDCGFNNVTYFNRLFYKKNGVTPTQCRKKDKE